jgi:hypothetical protein
MSRWDDGLTSSPLPVIIDTNKKFCWAYKFLVEKEEYYGNNCPSSSNARETSLVKTLAKK